MGQVPSCAGDKSAKKGGGGKEEEERKWSTSDVISTSLDVTRPDGILACDVKSRLTGVEDADEVNLVEAGLRIGFMVRGRLVVVGWVGCEEGVGEEREREAEEARGWGDEASASASECDGETDALLLVMAFSVEGEPVSYTRGGLGGGG